MVKVSIDVDAARGVVTTLRAVFDDAMDQWTTVANANARALVSTTALKGLSDPLVLISQSAKDLETRVELALLYNTGDHGNVPTGGVLTYELSGNSDSMAAVRRQLGVELAQNLREIRPYGQYLNREDVENFDFYAGLMEKYSQDPDVMTGLFEELGPEGAVTVPIMLKDFLEQYQRELVGKSDGDLRWDDDTPMSLHIQQMQQTFLESMSNGLATYSHAPGYDRDYADRMVEVAKGQNGEGWGLSQLLRYGDFESQFLLDVGEGLYEIEKNANGQVWFTQSGGTVSSWRLGTEDSGDHWDPFVGLFGAMGRNPEASADFFNPDDGGKTAQERAKYFIEDRTWQSDDFNALGEALDSAATAFHKPGDPRAEQAAWIASATVHFLSARDGDPAIGDAGKDSLAHLLSAYIADVDRVAGGEAGGKPPAVYTSDFTTAPWLEGLPPGATFSKDALNDVLGEVLTDDGAMQQLADAAAHFNAARIAGGADRFNADPSAGISGPVQRSGLLMGYLLGNLERGSEAAGKSVDERNEQFLSLASDVVGLIPTGGTLTSFLADQATSRGSDWVTEQLTGNEAAAASRNEDKQEQTRLDLQIAAAVALADSPQLPDSVRTDENGNVYPWFRTGDAEAALSDPATRDLFVAWMRDDAGQIAELLPDVSEAFSQGLERGR